MWLLNTDKITLEYINSEAGIGYAILSHTWEDDEVSFGDMTRHPESAKYRKGYKKIRYTCMQARSEGLRYAWGDTCCIDKGSSAELSESINSMYRWYRSAAICYVYLADVKQPASPLSQSDQFRSSRWFKRGWTLQELIAPRRLHFYSATWDFIAPLEEIIGLVSRLTGVPAAVLNHWAPPSSFSVAKRMSWASRRKTERLEDQAYCLLGLFDINMPMLYGEGEKAFIRLQEEIIRTSSDESIFAWRANGIALPVIQNCELLAPSPTCFEHSHDIVLDPRLNSSLEPFGITNLGLETKLQYVGVHAHLDRLSNAADGADDDEMIMVLRCREELHLDTLLGIRISSSYSINGRHDFYVSDREIFYRVPLSLRSNPTEQVQSGPRTTILRRRPQDRKSRSLPILGLDLMPGMHVDSVGYSSPGYFDPTTGTFRPDASATDTVVLVLQLRFDRRLDILGILYRASAADPRPGYLGVQSLSSAAESSHGLARMLAYMRDEANYDPPGSFFDGQRCRKGGLDFVYIAFRQLDGLTYSLLEQDRGQAGETTVLLSIEHDRAQWDRYPTYDSTGAVVYDNSAKHPSPPAAPGRP